MSAMRMRRREIQDPYPIETVPCEPKEAASACKTRCAGGRISRDAKLEARLQELAADYQRQISVGIE